MVSKGHWNNIENHKKYALETLAPKYNLKLPNSEENWQETWYILKQKHFKDSEGGGLLNSKYSGSPSKFIKEVFPEFEWIPWKFAGGTTQGFWKNKDNVRKYLDWLMIQMNYNNIEEFYHIKQNDFRKYKGIGLQDFYGNRLPDLLRDGYPEIDWLDWNFDKTTTRYFDSIDNQIKFINYIEKQEGISCVDDWYKYNGKIIEDYGGIGLLANNYNHSFIDLIKAIYPTFDFKQYKFNKTKMSYWKEINNQKEYITDFMKFHEINECDYEKLYDFGYYDYVQYKGRGILDIYNNNYITMLKAIIKDFNWEDSKFIRHKTEAFLFNFLKRHFSNVKPQFKLDSCKNVNHLPFDFVLEDTKIIIELDGPQHFKDTGKMKKNIERDLFKMKKAKESGYKLIRISQEDVLKFKDTFLNEKLLPEIQSENKCIAFIATKPGLYDEHISSISDSSSEP